MDDPQVEAPQSNVWDKLTEETELQYTWFSEYYLPLGFVRSIKRAYVFWATRNLPPGEQRLNIRPPNQWFDASNAFGWVDRAAAYDIWQADEASRQVRQALLNLRMSTVAAVETLIKQLENPRNGVSAAKEILDRGGIPSRSVSDVNQHVVISADDMAKAAKEVEEWEKKILDPSGSSANEA